MTNYSNEDIREGLFRFIKNSPSAFHTISSLRESLLDNGFTELFEGDTWQIEKGKGYFTTRGGSSLIAFRAVENTTGFNICASHSDFPAFRVKQNVDRKVAYVTLDVEKYGGPILYSWFDRPLSVAGRVMVRTECGIRAELVNLDYDLCTIPSLAIHLNRGVNESFGPKLNVDLYPLYSTQGRESLMARIARWLDVEECDILSQDLILYNREEGRVIGTDSEFILCPRLDDLGCVYTSLTAFLGAEQSTATPVLAVFDNEEVGSSTRQGAASTFLFDTLRRLCGREEEYLKLLASSFMVSADNAHAKHPNHPEMSDPENAPILGNGIVIKFNASQRYATDSVSHAIFSELCKRANVKTQLYYNRADLPGGSTLGSISDTKVSIPTVDIGLPQLAMHSTNETAASADLADMTAALTAFFSTAIIQKGDTVELK